MSNRFVVNPKDLPKVLREQRGRAADAVLTGVRNNAEFARTLLVAATPRDTGRAAAAWKVEATRKSLRSGAGPLAQVVNNAPYIGILDRGARPHPVSWVGVMAIAEWVERKLLGGAKGRNQRIKANIAALSSPKQRVSTRGMHQNDRAAAAEAAFQKRAAVRRQAKSAAWDEAVGIAVAIARKLKRYGQKPTYFVRECTEKARVQLFNECEKELARVSTMGPSSSGGGDK